MSSGHVPVSKPVLPARDLAEAIEFYERLGLDVVSYDAGYAWVLYGGRELLHLRLVTDVDSDRNEASAYLHVDDTDAWHARWSGVARTDPTDTEWGMREFSLSDPSGNLLRIGSNLD